MRVSAHHRAITRELARPGSQLHGRGSALDMAWLGEEDRERVTRFIDRHKVEIVSRPKPGMYSDETDTEVSSLTIIMEGREPFHAGTAPAGVPVERVIASHLIHARQYQYGAPEHDKVYRHAQEIFGDEFEQMVNPAPSPKKRSLINRLFGL